MAWNLYHTFTPTGTVSAGGAGSTLQDNNVDVQGSIWSIASGVLSAAGTAAYNTSHLTRPVGENQADARIVVSITNLTGTGALSIVIRRADANNFYLIQLNVPGFTTGAASATLYKYVAGSLTAIGASQFFTATSGHNYTFDGSALGTALAATVTDTTASSVLVNNYTQTDAALAAAGQYALSSQGGFGSVTQVQYYNTAAAPTAGTLTLGATGATTQALSLATDSGGTAPYSNQLQRAPDSAGSPGTWANAGSPVVGATASFTDTGLTPGTKYWWRVVVTDNASATANSNQVTTTIPATTVSAPSPAALVANTTGNTVSVVGTATSWASGTTWSVAGETGAAVTAKAFVDATHYTLTITSSTVNANGTLTLTNSADSSTATISVYSTTGGARGSRQLRRWRG